MTKIQGTATVPIVPSH